MTKLHPKQSSIMDAEPHVEDDASAKKANSERHALICATIATTANCHEYLTILPVASILHRLRTGNYISCLLKFG